MLLGGATRCCDDTLRLVAGQAVEVAARVQFCPDADATELQQGWSSKVNWLQAWIVLSHNIDRNDGKVDVAYIKDGTVEEGCELRRIRPGSHKSHPSCLTASIGQSDV